MSQPTFTKAQREAIDLTKSVLRRYRCEPDDVEFGRHIKVRFWSPTGRNGVVVIGISSSDRRAIRHIERDAKRAAINAGGGQ